MTSPMQPSADRAPFTRRRQDWTGIVIRVAEIVLIIALALTLTGSDSRRSASDTRSDRLAACRSLYNSDKEKARTVYNDAVTARDRIQTEALVALGNDEQAQFTELTHSLPGAFDAETKALDGLNSATDDYAAMSVLAVANPSAFLAKCDARADTG